MIFTHDTFASLTVHQLGGEQKPDFDRTTFKNLNNSLC